MFHHDAARAVPEIVVESLGEHRSVDVVLGSVFGRRCQILFVSTFIHGRVGGGMGKRVNGVPFRRLDVNRPAVRP